MTAQTKTERDPKGQAVATVELKKIGNSAGVILPKEVMARLNLSVGDKFYFEKAMEVARRGMKIYRNALAELAK